MNLAGKKININVSLVLFAALILLVLPQVSWGQGGDSTVFVPSYNIGGKCLNNETLDQALERIKKEGETGVRQYCEFALCQNSTKPTCGAGETAACVVSALNVRHDCALPTSCASLNESGAEKVQKTKIDAYNKWQEARLRADIARSEAGSAGAEVLDLEGRITVAGNRASEARSANQRAGVAVAAYQKKASADRTPEQTAAINTYNENLTTIKKADAEIKTAKASLTAAKKKSMKAKTDETNATKAAATAEKSYDAAAKKVSPGKELSCISSGSCSGGWQCGPSQDANRQSVGRGGQGPNRGAAIPAGGQVKRTIQVGSLKLKVQYTLPPGATVDESTGLPKGITLETEESGRWILRDTQGNQLRTEVSKSLQNAYARAKQSQARSFAPGGAVSRVAGGAGKVGGVIESAAKAAGDYLQRLITGQTQQPASAPSGAPVVPFTPTTQSR